MAGRAWRAAVAAVATAAVLATAACDIRLETDPLVTPTPDAVTVARDLAALQEADIVAALAAPATGGPGDGALRAIESAAAPAHLEVLGGVYVAYPGAAPEPSADPIPDLRTAVTVARDRALAQAFAESETDAGFLAGIRGFTHAFALWHAGVLDARAANVAVPVVAERTLPGPWGDGVTLVPETSAVGSQALAELAVLHDQARFTYEVIAARESGVRRDRALQRARLHRDRSDALAYLAGVDERLAVYELPGARVADAAARDETARDTELALGWRYMALTSGASAVERSWLMSAAFDAYAAAAMTEGFAAAHFPVLPGADPASS